MTKLEEYASLEGTEFGDFCSALVAMSAYANTDYGASPEFVEATKKEMARLLQYFKDNCTISTEIVDLGTIEERTLEWNMY